MSGIEDKMAASTAYLKAYSDFVVAEIKLHEAEATALDRGITEEDLATARALISKSWHS